VMDTESITSDEEKNLISDTTLENEEQRRVLSPESPGLIMRRNNSRSFEQ
jgi:hypothetical protein